MTEAFNTDCMTAMAQMKDNEFDLAIVDPPYGINYSNNFDQRKDIPPPKVEQFKGRKAKFKRGQYEHKEWDESTPIKNYFINLFRISKNQIIWGGNYFILPQSRGWIIWDKNNDLPTMSDAELAWTSYDKNVKICYYTWNGFKQAQQIGRNSPHQGASKNKEIRIHPTQKPIALYKWLLKNYAKEGDRILDTHLGSGSSRIAAHDMGFDFVGYEIDKDYFDAQEKRFANHIKQQTLFNPNEMY